MNEFLTYLNGHANNYINSNLKTVDWKRFYIDEKYAMLILIENWIYERSGVTANLKKSAIKMIAAYYSEFKKKISI